MAGMGYGIVGAGAFGGFCVETYQGMPEINVQAVADRSPEAAIRFAGVHGLRVLSFDEMLADTGIGIVHVATPPSTHRELAGRALAAGKHVLVEKPLATTVEDGEALVAMAAEHDRLLAVNLIMRYDPLLMAVKEIAERGLLGAPLRGTLENWAKDARLGPGHWFWDEALSGGIFVEHAVHFFDLFAWLFGPGEATAADQAVRPGSGAVEAVRVTTRHALPDGGSVLVDQYHGFTQPEALDRQEFRLLFERGDVRLSEWVPTRAEVTMVGTLAEADEVAARLPQVESRASIPVDGPMEGRWKAFPADGVHTIRASVGMAKDALYRRAVGDLMLDALAWTGDRGHVRRVTERDALASLRTAVAARALARGRPDGSAR